MAETDKSRERLDWLRYRLVASDALALKWPSGLIKLAATDAQTRRDAATELPKMTAYRTGMGRPKWMSLATDPLHKLLVSASAEVRLAGAAALIALGDEAKALPELKRIATEHRHLVTTVAKSLR